MAERNLDPNVRLVRDVALAAGLWVTTFFVSKGHWLKSTPSVPLRVALVVVGVAGFIPVLFVYARAIRLQDEFNQRIHLVALAVAFALVGLISYTADMLADTGFIEAVSGDGLWMLMIAMWFICMLVTPRFYR